MDDGQTHRTLRRALGMFCLAAILGVAGLHCLWFSKAQRRQAAREQRLNATEHEMHELHRGDLDRG